MNYESTLLKMRQELEYSRSKADAQREASIQRNRETKRKGIMARQQARSIGEEVSQDQGSNTWATALAEAMAPVIKKPKSKEEMPEDLPIPKQEVGDWADIQSKIFKGESGGDYDALFGYSNREGGAYSDVKVTEMTLDEVLAFQDTGGEYGKWVKRQLAASGQEPRIATPVGAYQIVGTTLKAAKEGLGLTGKEKFTPELQDELGKWIYQQQGTGAWEGYAG